MYKRSPGGLSIIHRSAVSSGLEVGLQPARYVYVFLQFACLCPALLAPLRIPYVKLLSFRLCHVVIGELLSYLELIYNCRYSLSGKNGNQSWRV